MVVRFIENNCEMFDPFVEDEVPFDEYCRSMGQEGNWAGHMELQAASLVTHSNICIHTNKSSRWYTLNFDILEAQMIHISYHDGDHYNIVRSKDDSRCGPAMPIVIKALQVGSDVDAELLIAEQGSGDHLVAADELRH